MRIKMKRKGKPKTKTKEFVCLRKGTKRGSTTLKSDIIAQNVNSSDNNNGDNIKAGTLEAAECFNQRFGPVNITNNPLISISMAPSGGGSSRSATSCASSIYSFKSQVALDEPDGATERSSELSRDEQNESTNERVTAEVGRLSVDLDEVDQDKSSDQDDEMISSSSSFSSSHDLYGVKRSYLKLINYNRLQYFYMGALIYSVSCLVFIFNLIHEQHEAELSTNNKPLNETRRLSDDEDSCSSINGQQLDRHFLWQLIGLIIPATFLLTSIVLIKLIGFDFIAFDVEPDETNQESAAFRGPISQYRCFDPRDELVNSNHHKKRIFLRRNKLVHYFKEHFGIFLALLLFILPIGMIYMKQVPLLRQANDCPMKSFIDFHLKVLPLSLVNLLVYAMPSIFSEIPTVTATTTTNSTNSIIKTANRICRRHLIYLIVIILPIISLVVEQYKSLTNSTDSQEINAETVNDHRLDYFKVILISLAFALLCGQLKRRKLIDLSSEQIFRDANELIGAKVSLEQQRQQQETLLLSVLPAYVAEQVKRNMVKKMESLDEQRDSVSNTDLNSSSANLHHHLIVSTSNVSTQTFGSPQVRSLTLPSCATFNVDSKSARNQVDLNNNNNDKNNNRSQRASKTVDRPTQRHSLVRLSRLSNSLASSAAAYICDTLLSRNNNSETEKPASQSQLVSTSTQVEMIVANSSQNLETIPSQTVGMTTTQSNFMPNIITTSSPSHPSLTQANSMMQLQVQQQQQSRRGFNELHIRTYNNVSLLYGDIVGFTSLCTQLSSSQLVRVLNNLFSYFDYLADQHKIMRIKILGDCYYGVSGIPEFAVMGAKSCAARQKINKVMKKGDGVANVMNHEKSFKVNQVSSQQDNHAINCVNMGLDMIGYIKRLTIEREPAPLASPSGSVTNEQQFLNHQDESNQEEMFNQATYNDRRLQTNRFELNMRIGIHTGHIHSGVIGLKKWQFDVWSNDVSIAMHCESSGVAGRVQVTEATIQHLHNEFTFEPAPSTSGPVNSRDQFLTDKEIKTYLIKDRVRPLDCAKSIGDAEDENENYQSKNLIRTKVPVMAQIIQSENNQMLDEDKIRAATIGTIRQTLLSGEMPSFSSMNAIGLAFDHNDMNKLTLSYKDSHQEQQFQARSVSLGQILGELIILFISILMIMFPIDYLLLGARMADNPLIGRFHPLILFGVIICCSLILMICLLIKRTANYKKKAPQSSPKSVPLNENEDARSPSPMPLREPSILIDQYEDQLEACENNNSATKHWTLTRSVQSKMNFCNCLYLVELRSKFMRWAANKKLTNQGAYFYFSSFIFISVILGQLFIILQDVCFIKDGKKTTTTTTINDFNEEKVTLIATNQQARVELYQMTVILVLIVLDLSVALLNYVLKSILILLILLAQLALLVSGYNMPTLIASLFNCSPSTSQNNDQPVEDDRLYAINWFSHGLLLVMAIWSLAHARQLEYSIRCNFLWRNRLNVDHEELEYISGINKVLLENILPSHVVQHYLTASNKINADDGGDDDEDHDAKRQATVVMMTRTLDSDGQAQIKTCSSTSRRSADKKGRRKPSISRQDNLDSSSGHQNRLLLRMSLGNARKYLKHEQKLYHEQHESVAVMFASIPHFYEFYDETDISKQGLGCIALLNEIICDFDKLLLKNKFSRIEKIKTIGSTYMAAAGLRPCSSGAATHLSLSSRTSQASQISQPPNATDLNQTVANSRLDLMQQQQQQQQASNQQLKMAMSQPKMNLVCMIQFATSLMSALNGINKQSFQVFKLRVGVNTGSVIAGIIGAQRPFYDIWGDCVNIASRMESTGEVGRIQVEERTANLLTECLCAGAYSIQRRGHINVKGKGGMVTYFVDKRQPVGQQQQQPHQQVVQHQTSIQTQLLREPHQDQILSSLSHDSLDDEPRRQDRAVGLARGTVSDQ